MWRAVASVEGEGGAMSVLIVADSTDQGASAGAPEIKESDDAERLLSSLVSNSTLTWGAGGGGSIGAPLLVEHTSSVIALLYHTTRGTASSTKRKTVEQG